MKNYTIAGNEFTAYFNGEEIMSGVALNNTSYQIDNRKLEVPPTFMLMSEIGVVPFTLGECDLNWEEIGLVDIEITAGKYPRYNGSKMPKSKRIKDKWNKKYINTHRVEGVSLSDLQV